MQNNVSMIYNNLLTIFKYKVNKTETDMIDITPIQYIYKKRVLTRTIHGKKREIKLLLKCPIMQTLAIIANTSRSKL